jgi:molecular chaperone GrpE (heat shock protein)
MKSIKIQTVGKIMKTIHNRKTEAESLKKKQTKIKLEMKNYRKHTKHSSSNIPLNGAQDVGERLSGVLSLVDAAFIYCGQIGHRLLI